MTEPTSQSSAQSVHKLVEAATGELASINDTESLEAWRVAYLGRRGHLTLYLRGLAGMDLEERRVSTAEIAAMMGEAKADGSAENDDDRWCIDKNREW